MVVVKGQYEHEECHEEETHELDYPAPNYINEGNSEPVPRDSGAKCKQCLCPADPENLLQSTHGLPRWQPAHSCVDVLLEQVLAVECNVKQKPGTRGSQELQTMSLCKLH